EAEAAPAQRLDLLLLLAVVADRAPRLLEQPSQGCVGDLDVAPERAAQDVFGDDTSAVVQEQQEEIEHERLHAHCAARAPERAGLSIELAVAPEESHSRRPFESAYR